MGCYWDKGWDTGKGGKACDLPIVKAGGCGPGTKRVTPPVRSLAECESLCASDATHPTYFAVQNGGSGCFCGDAYGKYGPSTNCTRVCGDPEGRTGNPLAACGGVGCNSIYRISY